MAHTDPMDVAVIIPCYNVARWVGDAIESVLAQTEPPTEVIAVDDGSTDDTGRILETFGSRISVVTQANGGLGAARNAGAMSARSSWLAFLDADDVYRPEALAAYRELHQVFPEARVLFADFDEFDDKGQRWPPSASVYLRDIGRFATRTERDCFLLQPPAELVIARNGAFTPSCLMLRRDLFLEVGRFDDCRDQQGAEDLDLYFRLLPTEAIAFINRAMLSKRRHDGNMSGDGDKMRHAAKRALERADTLYGSRHAHMLPIVRRKKLGLLAGWVRYDVQWRRPGALAASASLVAQSPLTFNAWWLLIRALARQ